MENHVGKEAKFVQNFERYWLDIASTHRAGVGISLRLFLAGGVPVCHYVPNSSSEYPYFLESYGKLLEGAPTLDSQHLCGQ